MSVVFRCEQKAAGFSDCDFRDGGNEFQHIGPETANAREPYVTVLVRGKSTWVAARSWRRVVTAESGEQSDDRYIGGLLVLTFEHKEAKFVDDTFVNWQPV